ncbi:tubulin binding cofactor A [Ramicandelaber brevisporus]|nr:tubulin binding cofactor A [Ramicandelaber brevisporus]
MSAKISPASKLLKDLTIKTNSVRRLLKELNGYRKEVQDQEKKVAESTAAGIDEHDLRYQQRILQESVEMVDNVQGNLRKAVETLETVLKSAPEDATAEIEAANQVLEDAQKVINP